MTIRKDTFAIPLSALCLASVSCGTDDPGADATTASATPGSGTPGAGMTGATTGSPDPAGTSDASLGPGTMSPAGTGAPGATQPSPATAQPGMGGTAPGPGTVQPNMGGSAPGMGGSQAGIGGTAPGTGGTAPGTGGTAPGAGGTAPGAGGSQAGGGGTDSGMSGAGGTDAAGGESTAGTGGSEGTGEPEFHIYLAVGQSNMQGAAHVPDEPVFHERVMALQGQNCPASDGHSYGYGEWREMFTPMIRCYEGTRDYPEASGPIGLGPADSFAVTMAEAAGENVTIGIVGAAYGGTDIQAHLPNCGSFCTPPFGDVSGAPVVNGTTPIYEWIKDLGTKAQERGVIKGIIFHHGENNSGDPTWLGHVNTYVTSLRNDLGLDPAEVPFIAGELPRTGCCAAHNSLVQQIPDNVENGHWVSSGPMEDGTVLSDRGDELHWSTFSVIEMGKRYAAKMLEVGNY